MYRYSDSDVIFFNERFALRCFFESGQQSSLLSIYHSIPQNHPYVSAAKQKPPKSCHSKICEILFWGSKSDEGWRFGLFKTISPFLQFVPSWQKRKNISPPKALFKMCFVFPKVGYVTFLEGISLKQLQSDNIELLNPSFYIGKNGALIQ